MAELLTEKYFRVVCLLSSKCQCFTAHVEDKASAQHSLSVSEMHWITVQDGGVKTLEKETVLTA